MFYIFENNSSFFFLFKFRALLLTHPSPNLPTQIQFHHLTLSISALKDTLITHTTCRVRPVTRLQVCSPVKVSLFGTENHSLLCDSLQKETCECVV